MYNNTGFLLSNSFNNVNQISEGPTRIIITLTKKEDT